MIAAILLNDLPNLDGERLAEVDAFVRQRISQLVGPAGAGVRLVGRVMTVVLARPWRRVTLPMVSGRALPVVGDFIRLVRSLGYAYIWERWPQTQPSGASK